jgi:hexokinase
MRDFHRDMSAGLAGRKSSLRMIPTYVGRITGKERGEYFALDLGGTNFRVLALELCGDGVIGGPFVKKFVLPDRLMVGKGDDLFRFLAAAITRSAEEFAIKDEKQFSIGFTFSFPVKQTSLSSGALVSWTKGFKVSGVEGKNVVDLLNAALQSEGLKRSRVVALINDTVGTLAAQSYKDPSCDVGVILGTGTNACYMEKVSEIHKLKNTNPRMPGMVINIEWGNFDKVRQNEYDKKLDKSSRYPGRQKMEKMISGMYLGELCRITLLSLVEKKKIFVGIDAQAFKKADSLKSEYVSVVEADDSDGLKRVEEVLQSIGIHGSRQTDRRAVRDVCGAISDRAAFLSALAIAAVVTKIDPKMESSHTVAVDGTVFERHHLFAERVRKGLREVLKKKVSKIKLVMSKDGSGIGAAIVAAIADK